MAYDEGLAQRVQVLLDEQPGLLERKMFGGVGFMLQGNMACGVNGEDLIVRVGPAGYEESLAQPFTRPFDFTGRPMKGWLMVSPEGTADDQALADWVQKGVAHALSLPPK